MFLTLQNAVNSLNHPLKIDSVASRRSVAKMRDGNWRVSVPELPTPSGHNQADIRSMSN